VQDCNALAWLTFFVLLATLVAIVWYSLETRWLRQEVAGQTELQQRPLLTVTHDDREKRLLVENIGNGIARDITLEETELGTEIDAEPGYSVLVRWKPIDYVTAGAARDLWGRAVLRDPHGEEAPFGDPDSAADMGILRVHFSPHARGVTPRRVVVEYGNLINTRYQTTVRIDKGFSTIAEDRRL
jgi:hypothetical protein